MKTSLKILLIPSMLLALFIFFVFKSNIFGCKIASEGVPKIQIFLYYLTWIGLLFASAILVNRMIKIFFWEGIAARQLKSNVPKLLTDLSSMVIYLFAFFILFGYVFDQPLSGLWATSGAIGIVLGLAIKNMILDVLVGLAVHIENPYDLGDYVLVHGTPGADLLGKVIEVNWRTTKLQTIYGNAVVVPNSLMGTSVVTNYQRPDSKTRVDIEISVDFHVPTERVRRVLLAGAVNACQNPGFVTDKAPRVRIHGIGDCGIIYRIKFWINAYVGIGPRPAQDIVYKALIQNLQQAGIPLAYPKSILYHKQFPEQYLDTRNIEDQYHLLSRMRIFSTLTDEELHFVVEKMKRHFFHEGDQLIEFGDEGDSMFIVEEGLLFAFVDIQGNGTETQVGQIQAGEFFGEMSLLTGESRSATVKAATNAVCVEISKDIIRKLFQQRPDLAETISKTIAERQVMNELAKKHASKEEMNSKTDSIAEQLLGKIRNFFSGVFNK